MFDDLELCFAVVGCLQCVAPDPEGAPLHDPCVIAYLLKPEIFKGRHINVTVETGSELTVGMTVADYWGVTGRVRNVNFMRSADVPAFFELLTKRIARLP